MKTWKGEGMKEPGWGKHEDLEGDRDEDPEEGRDESLRIG
jgi:hypothetical protein